MGTDLAAQASSFSLSLAFGALFALLYDLMRALRLRRRRSRLLTDALDVLYCLALALALFSFALRVGDGELRLYMLFGSALGAVLFFCFLSPLLRPLWGFWAEVAFVFLHLLQLPFSLGKKFYGKLHKLAKKLFYFSHSSFIIENYRRFARSVRRRAEKRGGDRR